MPRPDREDLTAQRERLADARADLADALGVLVMEAEIAARPLRSAAKRLPEPNLSPVLAAMARVREAENVLDMAKTDLTTAGGADL